MPVVFGKEHDDDGPWTGSGAFGWPIFQEGEVPRFNELKLEPRVAIQGFKDIQKRALRMCQRWKESLEDAKALGPESEGSSAQDEGRQRKEDERQALKAAIYWWKTFLAGHNKDFGPTAPPFAVVEGSKHQINELLPIAQGHEAGTSSMDISNVHETAAMCVSEATEEQPGAVSPPNRTFIPR